MQLIYFKWVTENYFFFVWRVKKQNHWFACEYAFNFKAWSLINDRWPHQQLLYTTLIFRAGLSRQEATVGGVAPPHQQQQRHHAAFGRSWSRRSIVTQNLRTNLFSVGVLAQALYQWVYFFHFLFPFLTFIACVSVLESLVVSPAIILLEFFQSLLLLCRLLFILRSSEFVSVAVSQLFSVLEMELPWFPSLLK